MKLACWSIIREVGAFAGITASFTITAIVASTLKCRNVHTKKYSFDIHSRQSSRIEGDKNFSF